MALETATYISNLVSTNPTATDTVAQADDHIRLIKSTLQNTFPNVTSAITADHTEINVLDGITSTTAELNILDGVTATAADLNYAADLNATGVTSTEYSYLSGITSNIQAQITSINTDLVNDATPQLAGTLDTNGNAIQFGSWTIQIDGSSNLTFSYGGDVKMRITAAGALDVEDDITAYSGI